MILETDLFLKDRTDAKQKQRQHVLVYCVSPQPLCSLAGIMCTYVSVAHARITVTLSISFLEVHGTES